MKETENIIKVVQKLKKERESLSISVNNMRKREDEVKANTKAAELKGKKELCSINKQIEEAEKVFEPLKKERLQLAMFHSMERIQLQNTHLH